MNYKVPERKHEMEEALRKLEAAADATAIAHDVLIAIPTKGMASWGRGEDRKNATADLKAAQNDQALCQNAFNLAVAAYEEAVKLQAVADAAAAEADKAARDEVKTAAARILNTEAVETIGKSRVRAIEKLNTREEKIRAERASLKADLDAAVILGFDGTVAE